MRELVIVISDLYLSHSAASLDATAQLLLPGFRRATRYGSSTPISQGWRAWLASWAGRDDLATAAPAAVAAVVSESLQPESGSTVWFASPVHLTASLTSVHLDFLGLLELDRASQDALRESFLEVFGSSGYGIVPAEGGGFLAKTSVLPEVRTTDPARCLGSTIGEALPTGPGAAELRKLSSEMEMWLHDHAVNVARVRRGQRPVSTLWIWGGGAPMMEAADNTNAQETGTILYSSDAFVRGLARVSGVPLRPIPESAGALFEQKPERAAVIVNAFRSAEGAVPASPLDALREIDRRWIVPALEALGRVELERFAIVANDRLLSLRPRDRWRFWRRDRGALAGLQ